MTTRSNQQSTVFRGIYEFEDPSGAMIAAKVPHSGTADLYDGTVIVVKPNQCAILVYKGQIADVLPAGTHEVKTGNLPLISRLASWRFGFQSPLRCEIWFFSGNVFTSRRWGTSHPVMHEFEKMGAVPLRAYGNFSLVTRDPKKVLMKLIGSRVSYEITELEEFVQGVLVEKFPEALKDIANIQDLSKAQDAVSKRLQAMVTRELSHFGVQVQGIQVLSILPPKDVLDALDAKAAMKVIGNQREYLFYKAANSLDALHDGKSNDSMQMMLGLMMGKGLMGHDFHEKEKVALPEQKGKCAKCSEKVASADKFCSHCGARQ